MDGRIPHFVDLCRDPCNEAAARPRHMEAPIHLRMHTKFRALLACTLLPALAAQAQLPYTLLLEGTVAGCTPLQQVTVSSLPGTAPAFSYTLDLNPLTCGWDTAVQVLGASAAVQVTTTCSGMVVSTSDSAFFNFLPDTVLLVMDLSCGGGATDCLGLPNGPNMPGTPCNDGDPLTINDVWDANCSCSGLPQATCQASFSLQQNAPWQITATSTSTGQAPFIYQWWLPDGTTSSLAQPSYTFNAPGIYSICLLMSDANACTSVTCDTVGVDSSGVVNTGTFWFDCLGVLNGTALPGTPCDDGDPNTFNDTWTAVCGCTGQGGGWVDCLGVTNGPDVPGAPCDDNDPMTAYSTWAWNCVCVADSTNGTTYDCLGMLNGPAMPGTPCDDGDPGTFNDTWNGSCTCVGTGGLPCEADFIVTQAYDSLLGPIPGTIWVFFLNNGGQGFTYAWDFGDGSTSNVVFPSHTYSGNGPYQLCLTVSGFGCTDTFCDSVGVDSNGIILPMGAQSQGFTINVMGGTVAIADDNEVDALSLAPNPAGEQLMVRFHATHSGPVDLHVLDMAGKSVQQHRGLATAGTNVIGMDLGSLDAGIYVLRIGTGTAARSERFVIAR